MPTYTYTPKLWNGVNLEGSPYTGVQFDPGCVEAFVRAIDRERGSGAEAAELERAA